MNKLFPLEVMGQGTAEIESLASYLLRSAYEHGVSAEVLRQGMYQMSKSPEERKFRGLAGKNGVATLARVNQPTRELCDLISELTGQDVRCGPLIFLDSKVFGVSSEIEGFRWCPECLLEWTKIGAPLYFKQIWHMRPVSHCPIHRVKLLEQCEWCDCYQNSLRARYPIGACCKCGEPLFKRKKPILPKDINRSWACASYDVLDVFEKTAKFTAADCGEFSRQEFKFFVPMVLKNGRHEYILGDHVMDAVRQCELNWRGGFRLTSLRRLAYQLNISLYELLTFSGNVRNLPLIDLEPGVLPEHLKVKKREVRDHEYVHQKILTYLDEQESPPSLKQVARFASVSVGYLEYRFPSLVRTIVDNYLDNQSQKVLANRYRAQAAAFRFFTNDRYADHSQSRKEAFRVLKEETGLPKWVLKNAIQAAYVALHAVT